MRRLVLALAVLPLLSSVGCTRAPFIPYHSTASIPHYSRSQMSAMTFVRGDEDLMSRRQYGVLAAVDADAVPYVLIAPKRSNKVAARNLSEINVGRGAPVSPERAREFIDGLEQVLSTWDRDLERDQGFFYEFMYAPEQDIDRVSESVIEWRPAVSFHYSHSERGPAAVLRIGGGSAPFVSRVDLRNREQIEDLRSLLIRGVDQLPASGETETAPTKS